MRWQGITLSISIALSVMACHRRNEPITPNLPVYYEAHLQSNKFRPLLAPGGIVLLHQTEHQGQRIGFGGIAIVHGLDLWQFYAFDLSCPYENQANIRLHLDASLQLVCPKCHTEYDVLSGSGLASRGIGKSPLRKYSCRYQAANQKLTITN